MPEEIEELRVWIVIRRDLGMSAGKMAAQVGHAIAGLILDNFDEGLWRIYMSEAQPKIAVSADSEHVLKRAVDEAFAAGIYASIIQDAGRTEFPEPTYTVAAIGPCMRSQLPSFVKRLQLYKCAPSSAGSEHQVPSLKVEGSSPSERTILPGSVRELSERAVRAEAAQSKAEGRSSPQSDTGE